MNPSPDPFTELASRTSGPRPGVFDAVRAEVQQHQKPRKAMRRSTRLGLSTACLFVGVVATSLAAMREDTTEVLLLGAAGSVGLGAILLSGIAPGRAGRVGAGVRRALLVALGILLVGGLGIHADHFLPAQDFVGQGHGKGAMACAGHALVTGALCTAGLIFLWKRTDPFTPVLTGAMLGAFGAVLGISSLGVLCPSVEGWHLLLGHGTSVLLLALLGAATGKKWLTP